MEAADHLSGQSLRSWAVDAVTHALSTRQPAPDNARLMGRTIPTSPEAPEASAAAVSDDDTTLPPSPHPDPAISRPASRSTQPQYRQEKTDPGFNIRDTMPQPAKRHTTAPPKNIDRPPASSTSSTDVLIIILKGLLIGGSIGFLIVVLLAYYLLTR
jgi:hypothetical protein